VRSARVLVVDDDRAELERYVEVLGGLPGVRAEGCARSTDAVSELGSGGWDLMVTDLRMPVVDGMDLVRVAAARDPDLPILVLTGFPSVDSALSALKEGASDYLTKPVHAEELQAVAGRLLEQRRLKGEHRLLQRRLGHVPGETEARLVGASPPIVEVLDLVRRLAASDLDILIVGETGTGKELVARAMHRQSPRASGRFVPVDCGAIPEQLLESELFGHEKGAFTGADRRALGLLEYADGGTFFLDEVQSLPPRLQAKLLRALQERRFRRVGGNEEIKVTLPVVAAVNEPPEALVRLGRLREDFYHRLDVGRVELPPLRQRTGDVALLASHFLARFGRRGLGPQSLSAEALALLEAYAWPGNVRQLQNVLRRALALAEGDVIDSADLPAEIRGAEAAGLSLSGSFPEARDRHLAAFERTYVEEALRESGGDVSRAAGASGISRATLYRMLRRHGVDPDRFRPS